MQPPIIDSALERLQNYVQPEEWSFSVLVINGVRETSRSEL